MVMQGFAEDADLRSGTSGTSQQLRCGEGGFLGIVLGLDAMPATFLSDVLAQELMGLRIENADVKRIPLDVDELSNPARWHAVVGGFDFDAAIQMHDAFAVLVITEGFNR